MRGFGQVVIAYSGGVDSSFLAAVAHEELGDSALAVTAKSPSVSAEELTAAVALARQFGWRHLVIETNEMADAQYVANGPRRCYFCKNELYTKLTEIARAENCGTVVNGANVDDLGDYRPGMDAAKKFGVSSPLVEAGLKKFEIRELSMKMGLPTWDKPAQPCLSSRIPYGTPVSLEALDKIARAEASLRDLGFKEVRVRHHGDIARIEVGAADMSRFADPETREAALRGVRAAGYKWATLDLAGFRSGGLNDGIPK